MVREASEIRERWCSQGKFVKAGKDSEITEIWWSGKTVKSEKDGAVRENGELRE